MAVLRAKVAFAAGRRFIREGDVVDSADPVVKGREALFEGVEQMAERTSVNVEQATAAPGERRSVTRKRAAKKA